MMLSKSPILIPQRSHGSNYKLWLAKTKQRLAKTNATILTLMSLG